MIYAYNILTGYMAVNGSLFLHIPMLIAQAFFTKPPENLGEGYKPFEEACLYWWAYSLTMHILLASIHLSRVAGWIFETPPGFETVRQAFEMVAVLAETLNFALMLTLSLLFINSQEYFEEHETNLDLMTYRRWLTIEALMF